MPTFKCTGEWHGEQSHGSAAAATFPNRHSAPLNTHPACSPRPGTTSCEPEAPRSLTGVGSPKMCPRGPSCQQGQALRTKAGLATLKACRVPASLSPRPSHKRKWGCACSLALTGWLAFPCSPSLWDLAPTPSGSPCAPDGPAECGPGHEKAPPTLSLLDSQ